MAATNGIDSQAGATKNLKIFAGSINYSLAEQIAKDAGVSLSDVEIIRFPDNETFVKIADSIRGADVFIVQSACKQPNEAYMELFLMIDAARRASADRITAVIPYYGYARQDRKDQPRVPISAALVAKLLEAAGANRVVTFHLHAAQIQGYFDIPVDHLEFSPVLLAYLRKSLDVSNLTVVSPDTGGVKAANFYAKELGTGIGFVAKERCSGSEVKALNFIGDVKGKDAIIIDDMTSTCGTLCAAAETLMQHGAKSVRAAVTHAMLNEKGLARLKQSPIKELIVSDSVPMNCDISDYPVTVLSVSELFAKAILRIHNNQSINELFHHS